MEGRELLGKLSDLPRVKIEGEVIAIGPVRFYPNRVTFERGAKLDDGVIAGIFVQRTHQSNMWWLGDWSLVMESFGEEAAQYISAEHFTENNLKRARWVCTKIEPKRRVKELAFEHHAAVAKLPESDQDRWLARALKKNLSVMDLRRAMRKQDHERRYLEEDMPEGKFRVLYIDPPWEYNDSGVITDNDAYGRAERHYPTMPLEEIQKVPVVDLAARNSALFLWVPSPLILSHAPPVLDAWKFNYKAQFIWDKVAHNFGHYNSVRHEHLLICTRGKMVPDAEIVNQLDSVQSIERSSVHSQKPEAFRALIDQMYPAIVNKAGHAQRDRIELFARSTVPEGWQRWGNEAPDGKARAAGESRLEFERDRMGETGDKLGSPVLPGTPTERQLRAV